MSDMDNSNPMVHCDVTSPLNLPLLFHSSSPPLHLLAPCSTLLSHSSYLHLTFVSPSSYLRLLNMLKPNKKIPNNKKEIKTLKRKEIKQQFLLIFVFFC
jgi:hypothetical protein